MPNKHKPSTVTFDKEIEHMADFYQAVLGMSEIHSAFGTRRLPN
jgi:catechol-2,3-dioxygenase